MITSYINKDIRIVLNNINGRKQRLYRPEKTNIVQNDNRMILKEWQSYQMIKFAHKIYKKLT